MTRSVGHLPINSSSELRHRPTTASPDSGLQGAQLVQVPQLSRGCTSEYSPCGVCALRGTHRHAAPGGGSPRLARDCILLNHPHALWRDSRLLFYSFPADVLHGDPLISPKAGRRRAAPVQGQDLLVKIDF